MLNKKLSNCKETNKQDIWLVDCIYAHFLLELKKETHTFAVLALFVLRKRERSTARTTRFGHLTCRVFVCLIKVDCVSL